MRFYDFDARYTSEVVAVLDRLQSSIRGDIAVTGEDYPNGYIQKDARVGRICILVGELPADGAARVFPMVEQPVSERKAS